MADCHYYMDQPLSSTVPEDDLNAMVAIMDPNFEYLETATILDLIAYTPTLFPFIFGDVDPILFVTGGNFSPYPGHYNLPNFEGFYDIRFSGSTLEVLMNTRGSG